MSTRLGASTDCHGNRFGRSCGILAYRLRACIQTPSVAEDLNAELIAAAGQQLCFISATQSGLAAASHLRARQAHRDMRSRAASTPCTPECSLE